MGQSQVGTRHTWAALFCAARFDCESSRLAFLPSAPPASGADEDGAGAMEALDGPEGLPPGLCPGGGPMDIMFAG